MVPTEDARPLIGRYRILRPLGTGGMGFVYLAHDPTLERDVALKLLHAGTLRLDKQADLLTEAKTLAQLSHPNIVTIFEIGEHEGQAFLTMEYLPGRTLREVMAAHAPRDVLVAICAKVASALEAAHRAQILHRDIKPENVVVGEVGEVKVVDFGIARRFDAVTGEGPRARTASEVVEHMRRTSPPSTLLMWGPDTEVSAGTQTAFGTPAYMAPEVLLGEPSNEASDVYSLGVVLFECLAGQRPYAASTLVEVIAQMIEEDPPALADPLGPLVGRMLLRARAERPALAEVVAALERAGAPPGVASPPPAAASAHGSHPASRARARRWPAAVVGAAVVAGLGVGAWGLWGRPDAGTERAAPLNAPAPPLVATISVELLTVTIPSYGYEPPKIEFVTDTFAKLIEQIEGAKLTALVGPAGGSGGVATRFVVRGSIIEHPDGLHGDLELADGATHRTLAALHETRPTQQLAPLLDALVNDLAHALAPTASLPPPPNPVRARLFATIAAPLLANAQFTDARPYYEQAVDADPSYFDGWYALASVLAWMQAPEPQVLAATDRALALAPAGPRHEIVRAVSLFLHGKYADARRVLEPIEAGAPAGGWPHDDERELLYYLGEVNWHDGNQAVGFDYFRRVLDLDQRFRPATVHAWEYPTARRDAERSRYYIGLAGESEHWLEFSLGHYEALAEHGDGAFRLWSQLVLGRTPPVALEPQGNGLDARTYRIARAVERGDLEAARGEFARTWAEISAETPEQVAAQLYALGVLGDVLACAEMGPELGLVVRLLAAQSNVEPARGYHRLSILAAPLLGDASFLVHDELTGREDRLATALTAEMAGHRGDAVRTLGELVADPTFSWDYPERAALIRNLRALGRPREAASVCADTIHPAIFGLAELVLRRTCGAR